MPRRPLNRVHAVPRPGPRRDLEWWRAREEDERHSGGMLFVDAVTADAFAGYLAEQVHRAILVEHWRGDRCLDVRVVEDTPRAGGASPGL